MMSFVRSMITIILFVCGAIFHFKANGHLFFQPKPNSEGYVDFWKTPNVQWTRNPPYWPDLVLSELFLFLHMNNVFGITGSTFGDNT